MSNISIMITDIDHLQHLESLKSELLERQRELGGYIQKQEELETRVASLREIIAAMSRMLGQEYVPEDAMGLTDAIRHAFKTAGSTPLAAVDVRERLKQLGFDITAYGNVLNSIHTVIGRLATRGEIKDAGVKGPTNQRGYSWAAPIGKIAPPPVPK